MESKVRRRDERAMHSVMTNKIAILDPREVEQCVAVFFAKLAALLASSVLSQNASFCSAYCTRILTALLSPL
jgi:hypothetical protein